MVKYRRVLKSCCLQMGGRCTPRNPPPPLGNHLRTFHDPNKPPPPFFVTPSKLAAVMRVILFANRGRAARGRPPFNAIHVSCSHGCHYFATFFFHGPFLAAVRIIFSTSGSSFCSIIFFLIHHVVFTIFFSFSPFSRFFLYHVL